MDELIKTHLADIAAAAEWLNREPANEDEADEQYKERKEIVQALVKKVYLEKDQEPKIELSLNLEKLLLLPASISR